MIRSDQALFPDRSQRSRRKSNRGGVASAPACTATSSVLEKDGTSCSWLEPDRLPPARRPPRRDIGEKSGEIAIRERGIN
ncbi:hypothetical protein NL676_031157 [Syzygium grande]|nr:hypothetical protein NL676_031157 [Syzygium grande]